MTEVQYVYVSSLTEEQFSLFLPYLSPEDQEKNAKYLRSINKYQHLLGRMLLAEFLHLKGYPIALLKELQVEEKPRLPAVDFHFNISHSDDLVICAISENEVGIDVEKINHKVSFEDFHNTMNDDQWKLIKVSDSPQSAFFDFWAAKESLIKADGRGLYIPLEDIWVHEVHGTVEGQPWQLQRLSIDPGYACCIAGEDLGEINVSELHPLVSQIVRERP